MRRISRYNQIHTMCTSGPQRLRSASDRGRAAPRITYRTVSSIERPVTRDRTRKLRYGTGNAPQGLLALLHSGTGKAQGRRKLLKPERVALARAVSVRLHAAFSFTRSLPALPSTEYCKLHPSCFDRKLRILASFLVGVRRGGPRPDPRTARRAAAPAAAPPRTQSQTPSRPVAVPVRSVASALDRTLALGTAHSADTLTRVTSGGSTSIRGCGR